jgi:Skp family chaperone for outer membrane proteins
MKSNLLFALLAASCLQLSTPAFAEDAKPVKIAAINIQQIMNDSTAAKSVREQLENKQKTFQAEITKKEESLQKEDQELAKQKSVLAKDAFEKKALEFRKESTSR